MVAGRNAKGRLLVAGLLFLGILAATFGTQVAILAVLAELAVRISDDTERPAPGPPHRF